MTDGGRPLSLGGPVQRRLLAALIARAPQRVSPTVLIDDLWGEYAPATAVRTLHSHVARLRRALGDVAGSSIDTIDSDYRLPLARSDLDAWVFEDLVNDALSGAVADPDRASADLRRALGLWRGAAYADLPDAAFAQTEIRRLEALRERALEAAIDTDLQRGMDAQLVPELEALVIEYPFRERLWIALIVALYRAGRQADALAAYQRARATLGEELGIDPGPELQGIEAKVLTQDPSLLATPPQSTRVRLCPWKGLTTYEAKDSPYYVGRDTAINEVLARLVDYEIVVLTGPSGSGKSSLVRAGVIPALSAGALIGSAEWRISLVTPARDALTLLGSALADPPDLLVIDSADDLVAGTPATIQRFGKVLSDASARGTRVLMTLRGDLFGRLGEMGGVRTRSATGTVLLGTPANDELRRVVEVPAQRAGLDVEPALVDAIIEDVGGRPGCLPLLSTALVRTWERSSGSRMTLAAYYASGGATSALERLADECYEGMGHEEQVAARRLLVHLVVNDEGRWRRRRLSLAEAAPSGDVTARTALEHLADARLVSIDSEGVQVTHEALTTAWPRFAGWLNERALVSAVAEHLSTSAHAWQDGGREDADLYRGARLEAALDMEAAHPHEIEGLEREFVAASRTSANRELNSLRRGRRRLGFLAASLVLLLSVAVVSGLLTMRARDEAQQAALVADAQRVGMQALGRTDTSLRLLLAVAAVRLHDDAGTRSSLLAAVQGANGPEATVQLVAPASSLSMSADGWVAVAEEGGLVEVLPPDLRSSSVHNPAAGWSEGTSTGTIGWLAGHETLLVGAADPDRLFVMDASNGGISVVGDGWNPRVFGATGDGIWAAAVDGVNLHAVPIDRPEEATDIALAASPKELTAGPGSTLVAVEPQAIEVIDPRRVEPLSSIRIPTWTAAAVSGDGRTAALARSDRAIDVIDLETGTTRRTLSPSPPNPTVLALSDDGLLLAGANGSDGSIRVWSTSDGLERARFSSSAVGIAQMAWSPADGRLLTISPGSATIQVWDPDRFISLSRPVTASAPQRTGLVTATAIDPVNRTLALGSATGRTWFVDLDSRVIRTADDPGRAPIVSIDFADGGRVAVTSDALGVISTWDPQTGRRVSDLTRPVRVTPRADAGRASVSPDGRTVAAFVDGYGLRLIDVHAGSATPPVYPDLGSASQLQVLGWTPDGRHLVVASQLVAPFGPETVTGGAWAMVDPTDGSVVWLATAPEPPLITDVAFVDDGRVVVIPGRSGRMYFLDAATGHMVDPSADSSQRVPSASTQRASASVTVSGDGQLMAVVSEGHPVAIWDVPTGTQAGRVEGAPQTVSAHFLSDTELVTVTATGSAEVHDLSASDWITSACVAAGRELTQQEWAHFLPGHAYRQVCSEVGKEPTT